MLMARDVLIRLLDLDPHRFPMIGSYYFYEKCVNYLLLFQLICFHT